MRNVDPLTFVIFEASEIVNVQVPMSASLLRPRSFSGRMERVTRVIGHLQKMTMAKFIKFQ